MAVNAITKIMGSTSESVDGSALPLKSIDDVHSSDGFSSGVLSVGDGISNNTLKESLKDLSGIVIDEWWDSLDSTSSGESSDCGLGDALNWGSGVSLGGSSLGAHFSLSSDSLSSFSLSGHIYKYKDGANVKLK